MLAILVGAIALLGYGVASIIPANAQSTCSPRAEFIEQLGERYEEKPVAVGLASTGKILEVLRSKDGETWTIILTDPEGLSCLAAVGEEWLELFPEFPVAAEESI